MANENRLIVNFLTLRWLIGWMGLLLPFALVLLNWIFFQKNILSSVSAYYHEEYVGAVFVGVMFAFGVFLVAYKHSAHILLGTQLELWPSVARWCAIPKFAILFSGAGYFFIAYIIRYFTPIRKS